MAELIIYNYDLSPFAEKIRLMLGYTDLSWKSVKVMEMPPRPVVDILTGGYRKIPVAQIGADIYCDTKTITSKIAGLSGKPELALENCAEDVRAFVRKTDGEVFMAIVSSSAGLGALIVLLRRTSILRTLRFIKDRGGMARSSKMKKVSPEEAKTITSNHLDEIEALLEKDFLFAERPCVADFSAYHSLWLAVDLNGPKQLKKCPKVESWFYRMQAFGHGTSTQWSDDQALDIARDAIPEALGERAVAVPKQVSIEPSDYGRDPVTGLLVGEHDLGWIIQREHPRIGMVHVHFPKVGFSLKDAA
jgi:glutathione S-transferase